MLKKIVRRYNMHCMDDKIEEKLSEIGLLIYSCEYKIGKSKLYIIPNPSKENTTHMDYVIVDPPEVSLSTLGKISPNLEKLLTELGNAGEIKQLK